MRLECVKLHIRAFIVSDVLTETYVEERLTCLIYHFDTVEL